MGFFRWDRLDLESKQGVRDFADAVNTYLRLPDQFASDDTRVYGALQHFTLTGDFPADVRSLALRVNEIEDIDVGHEQIFDIRDQAEDDGFDIWTTGGIAFTFDELKPGARTTIKTMAGAKIRIYFKDYQDALGWSPFAFIRRQYAQLEEGLAQIRASAYNSRAKTFYDLIETSAAGAEYQITWQGDAADTIAVRDAKTMNAAATDIVDTLKNQGMNVMAANFVVLSPLIFRDRIRAALSVVQQAFAGSPTVTAFPFSVVYSNLLDTANSYYVCLPRRKLVGRYQIPPTLRYDEDILQNLDYTALIMAYGGGIGAPNQLRECAMS
jgi:hypothetical protein